MLGDRPGTEIRTLSPVYKASFDHDGSYRLRVTAIGRYGDRSEPRNIDFQVTLPKPQTLWDRLLARWPAVLAAATGLYACGFIALLFLSRHRAWAFRALSDAAWAAWLTWPFFFLRHVPLVQRWVLEPWFQAMRRDALADVPFLDPPVSTGGGAPSEATALLRRLDKERRLWLHGRSGMGKSSVFAAWGRAYYAAKDVTGLTAAVRRYGFILIMLPLRDYAGLPVADSNRPEFLGTGDRASPSGAVRLLDARSWSD